MGAPENPGEGFDIQIPERDSALPVILAVTLLAVCICAALAAPIAAAIVWTWELFF